MLDYQVELGLVLKRPLSAGDHVTRETLGDFIGGFVLCNDVSAGDVMSGEAFLQWFRGKAPVPSAPRSLAGRSETGRGGGSARQD